LIRKSLLILLFLIPFYSIAEENDDKNIYSGGMHIFQLSNIKAGNPHSEISSLGNGIGGILRFYFGSNMTGGIFGGTQGASYDTNGSDNSHIKLGHGGFFFGLTHKTENYRYTTALGVGRGSIENLHIKQQSGYELKNSYLYNYGTTIYAPFVSVDRKMTNRLLLTVQASYFVADKMSYKSPVLKVGLLFNR